MLEDNIGLRPYMPMQVAAKAAIDADRSRQADIDFAFSVLSRITMPVGEAITLTLQLRPRGRSVNSPTIRRIARPVFAESIVALKNPRRLRKKNPGRAGCRRRAPSRFFQAGKRHSLFEV